jgi:copper chaperone
LQALPLTPVLLEPGVETFDIDLKEQKVTVKGNVKPEDVFQTVSKSGKRTSYWEGEATAPDAAAASGAEAAPGTAAEAPPAAAPAAPEITPAKADA